MNTRAPDGSNGYDEFADAYVSQRRPEIGVSAVRAWAEGLPRAAAVLDLGCGHGVPISDTLIDAGCLVYAIDASPRLAAAFHARFPDVPIACESIEESPFFHREFDAAIAWGVMFLLPLASQSRAIARIARVLKPGGSFLFTSPPHACSWPDNLTGRVSMSPGAGAYREMLAAAGLTVIRERDDEGGNHYYESIKVGSDERGSDTAAVRSRSVQSSTTRSGGTRFAMVVRPTCRYNIGMPT